MKRSEINALISGAKELLHSRGFALPPFAFWTPREWTAKGSDCDEIRKCRLGWDVTDFGSGDFPKTGLVIFTVRNGSRILPEFAGKTYAEKILIVRENQVTPLHFHAAKREDIICRSGKLAFRLFKRSPSGELDQGDVDVSMDGVRRTVKAGEVLVVAPGESVTLEPYMIHEFWAPEGAGTAVLGEVSSVNDDETDNYFLKPTGRFPEIEEDEPPLHLLCTEYP